jgi:hypothetical protein
MAEHIGRRRDHDNQRQHAEPNRHQTAPAERPASTLQETTPRLETGKRDRTGVFGVTSGDEVSMTSSPSVLSG